MKGNTGVAKHDLKLIAGKMLKQGESLSDTATGMEGNKKKNRSIITSPFGWKAKCKQAADSFSTFHRFYRSIHGAYAQLYITNFWKLCQYPRVFFSQIFSPGYPCFRINYELSKIDA